MATDFKNQPSFSPRRRWKIALDMIVRTILVLAVIVMVNYLGSRFFSRFYLSSQTQGLSARTLGILHSLTNRVIVTVYYDKDEELYPTIVALLNEYRTANPKISVQTVDYVRDAGEAEKIKEQYKFNAPTEKNLVIFDCDGRIKIVNGNELAQYVTEQVPSETRGKLEFEKRPTAFMGEMLFTSSLLDVKNPKPFKAYFLQGHGEPSLSDSSETGFLKFGVVLGENYIATVPLQLLGDNVVPDDCNLLIIAGPQTALSDLELQKINQYIAQGGRLLALFNYRSIHRPTGLEPILARWGVKGGTDVVQDWKNTTSSDGRDVIVYNFSKHPAVNPLTQLALQLIFPRPISRGDWKNPPADAPQVDELAFSSATSTLAGEPADAPRSYPLMVAVEQKPVAGVANARGTTRMIVVGDSFFLGNRQIESGANRDFLGDAANWLLDQTTFLKGAGPAPR